MIAKQVSPRFPSAAPRATSAAALQRLPLSIILVRYFFSVSCFSTSIPLAGKMAGKARNRPPKTRT